MWVPMGRGQSARLFVMMLGLVAACGRTTDSRRAGIQDGADSGSGGSTPGTGGASASGGASTSAGGKRSTGGEPEAGGAPHPYADAGNTDASVPPRADAGGRRPADASPMDGGTDGAALAESARVLVGSYDVWITDPNLPHCRLPASGSRLNLIVAMKDGALTAYLFEDGFWSYAAGTKMKLEAGALTLTPDILVDDPPDRRPTLVFAWGASGFEPQAQATVHLECDGGYVYDLDEPVRIEQDRTPPRLVANPYEDIGRVFPFTHIALRLTEPARLDSIGAFYPDPEDIDVRNQVKLVNIDTNDTIPAGYEGYPWMGPETDVVFLDQESVVGVRFRAEPVNLTDLAGNAALPDDRTYEVSNAGPIVTNVDFDVGPHPSTYGAATYFAQGSSGAPCESGGCLVMEGEIQDCDAQVPADSPALVTRFGFTETQGKATLRYRVWATNPVLLSLSVLAELCSEGVYVRMEPLATSEGVYTYASAWADAAVGPCLRASGQNPLIVLPPCIYGGGVSSEPARFVVESVVLNPPAPPPTPIKPAP